MEAHRRALVGPLWFRGLVAFLHAFASSFATYSVLVVFGATEWLSSPEDLLARLYMPSLICAGIGTGLFRLLQQWTDQPDPAFRLLAAGAVLILGAMFIAAPHGACSPRPSQWW